MKCGISFTGLLSDTFHRRLDPEDLSMFLVGCSVEHLPRPEADMLPNEVAWMTRDGEAPLGIDRYSDHLVRRSDLRPHQIEAYTRLWSRMIACPVFRVANYWEAMYCLLIDQPATFGGCTMGVDMIWFNSRWWSRGQAVEEQRASSGGYRESFDPEAHAQLLDMRATSYSPCLGGIGPTMATMRKFAEEAARE